MRIYSKEELERKLDIRNKISKIMKFILCPIIIFIIICSLSILYQKLVKRERYASLFGYKAFIVLSGSMKPCLDIKDIVVIKQVNADSINNNDIITFTEEGNLVTHRVVNVIIKEGKKLYQTKGDSNNTNDTDLVSYEDIQGKYAFKIGKLAHIFMTPSLLITIIIVIAIYYIMSNRRYNRSLARHALRELYEKGTKQ